MTIAEAITQSKMYEVSGKVWFPVEASNHFNEKFERLEAKVRRIGKNKTYHFIADSVDLEWEAKINGTWKGNLIIGAKLLIDGYDERDAMLHADLVFDDCVINGDLIAGYRKFPLTVHEGMQWEWDDAQENEFYRLKSERARLIKEASRREVNCTYEQRKDIRKQLTELTRQKRKLENIFEKS